MPRYAQRLHRPPSSKHRTRPRTARRQTNLETPSWAEIFDYMSSHRSSDFLDDESSEDEWSSSRAPWSSPLWPGWDGPTILLAFALVRLDKALENAPEEQIAAINFAKKLEPNYTDKSLRLPVSLPGWFAIFEQHRFYSSIEKQVDAIIHRGEFSSTTSQFLPALQRLYRSAIMGQHYINSARGDAMEYFGVGSQYGINCSKALAALPEVDRVLNTRHTARLQKRLESAKPFPFLSLPKDIRLMIYDYTLTSDRSIVLPRIADGGLKGKRFSMSLLAVSRAVHEEAADVFYGHNTFTYKSPCSDPDFRSEGVPLVRETDFFVHLGARYRRMVKKLEWCISYDSTILMLDLKDQHGIPTLSDLFPELRSVLFLFPAGWCPCLTGLKVVVPWRLHLDPLSHDRRLTAILMEHNSGSRHHCPVASNLGQCTEYEREVVAAIQQMSGGFREVERLHSCADDASCYG